MRVTRDMKDYIRDLVAKKVEGKLAAAKEAKRKCDDTLRKARKDVCEFAASLIPVMTEKVALFAKSRGLTFLEIENNNFAFATALVDCDFAELTTLNDVTPSEIKKIRDEPDRINSAIDKATNAIVFSLELGKVRKAELEELIESTEVEI